MGGGGGGGVGVGRGGRNWEGEGQIVFSLDMLREPRRFILSLYTCLKRCCCAATVDCYTVNDPLWTIGAA